MPTMTATEVTSPAPDSDPTLSTLIPRRSIRRNLLLASAAMLLLVAVWTSPPLLRPSVVSDSSGGSSTALTRQHQVLTMTQLSPDGWPRVRLQSVNDLPGARVAGAWVLADPRSSPKSRPILPPTRLGSTICERRSLMPTSARLASSRNVSTGASPPSSPSSGTSLTAPG